jgi:hypothetical protein
MRHRKVFFLSRQWKNDHPVLLRWKDYYESRGVIFIAKNIQWNIYYPDRKRKIHQLVKLLFELLRHRCFLMHSNDPDSGMLATWMWRLFRIPFIFDAHEVFSCEYPLSIESHFYKEHKALVEQTAMPLAKMVVVPNKQRVELFQTMYPALQHVNYVVIENKSWSGANASSSIKIHSFTNGSRTVFYGGTFWMGRKQESFPKLAQGLQKASMQLVLSGEHNDYLQQLLSSEAVFYAGNIPVNAYLDFAGQMDIALAWYYPTTVNDELCAPLKIFDYLAVNKPILAPRLPYLIELSERFPGVIHLFEPGNWEDCLEKAKMISASYDQYATLGERIEKATISWEGQYPFMDSIFKKAGIHLCVA